MVTLKNKLAGIYKTIEFRCFSIHLRIILCFKKRLHMNNYARIFKTQSDPQLGAKTPKTQSF